MDGKKHPDLPSLPQAPDNCMVDPLRLTHANEHLFVPADVMHDGLRFMYDRYRDPVASMLLKSLNETDLGGRVKCLPNLAVIMRMCREIDANCEVSPASPNDLIYNPQIRFTSMNLHEFPPTAEMSGVSVLMMREIGAQCYVAHFDEMLTPSGMLREGKVLPVAAKVSLEANLVRGVAGFGLPFAYTGMFWIMPAFLDQEERVLADLKTTLRRTLMQCYETRIREQHYISEKQA